MNKTLSQRLKELFLIIASIIYFGSVNAAVIKESITGKTIDDATIAAGKKLFDTKCQSCHALNNKLVGPALKDVNKRRTYPWLLKWIKNNEELRKSGDKDALDVFEKNNKIVMLNFTDLKDDEISSIIMYIEDASAGGGAKVEQTAAPVVVSTPVDENLVSNINWALLILLAFTGVIVFFIIKIAKGVAVFKQKV